ncbi:MAG: PilZ domain-containing protein [Marinobacter sp.]|uniref:PilZ domain-containing protein n=1 Tax=Marinobacter sp. TaxID=50741 RepID=UPI00299D88D8|nr:PilZ domain-containing protein [Marinobacter sp.]MDX1633396.1 PilZ domain-containing protein [Marinobacter sp.]
MKDYSEKRDFHRMRVNSEIQITTLQGETFTGICRDLSGTGMQLYVNRPVAEGDELLTLLAASGKDFPPFETSVRVLRAEPEGDGYLLGTAIIEVKR